MSAIPNQTWEIFSGSLKSVIALGPEHISVYSLIVEEGTPFATMYGEGAPHEKELPSEVEERKIYHETGKMLEAAGYYQYEISNYAKEGFEDAEIHGGEYDMSGGSIHHQPTDSYYTWSRFGTVTLADGEASVFVDAGLANRLNGVGSFRFEEDQAAALQRVEIYDVSTYCAEAAATDEMIAVMHEYMLANGVNLRREGDRPSTKEECGATGDVYCATCDTLLEESRELPKLPDFGDLPEPYAWFDTNGGALAISEGDTLIKHGGAVNLAPVAIGDTGEYGIKLSHNWQGLNFVVDLADLPDGKGVSLLIEYYADMEWEQSGLQLFRYNYTHNEHNNNDQNSRDDDHFEKTVDLLQTYFKNGGVHFQLTYVSQEDLICAKKSPDEYGNLRVRVTGFSDYFTRLADSMQDDIIARTTQK